MSTVVFVESNKPAIQALRVARDDGNYVVFITSSVFDWIYTGSDRSDTEKFANEVIYVDDTQDADCLIAAIDALQAERRIDAIITSLHWCVQAVADAADKKDLLFSKPSAIRNAVDKGRTREVLQKAGLRSVHHAVVADRTEAEAAIQSFKYPVIIKPLTGVAKILTSVANSNEDLENHFARVDAEKSSLAKASQKQIESTYLIEEVAVGPMYSVELGATASGEWIPFVILKRKVAKENRTLEMGSTLPPDFTKRQYDEATEYAIAVCKALGLTIGVFQVEFIYSINGPVLVEVNPRIAGGQLGSIIHTATGQNIYAALVDIHLGKTLGIGGFEVQRAASHTFVAAARDCQVRSDLPNDWFDKFRPHLSAGNVAIKAGDRLGRMGGNLDLKGFVQVTAESHDDVVAKVERYMIEVEAALGVPLVHSTEVPLKSNAD